MKKYINIADYQGGDWAVGAVRTLKEWREVCMDWADSDDNTSLYNELKYYKIKNKDLLGDINSIWSIEIVEFDMYNQEHLELAKWRIGEIYG